MKPDITLNHWHVLIVEDEPDNREIAAHVLHFHGAHVTTANNGQEALAALHAAEPPPTLVLLDLSMPKMDGWELLRQIRADARLAGLPVIALTAHAMLGDRERALAAGFDGYLTKPFSPLTLVADVLAAAGGKLAAPPPA